MAETLTSDDPLYEELWNSAGCQQFPCAWIERLDPVPQLALIQREWEGL
jgi:hypothetical protein